MEKEKKKSQYWNIVKALGIIAVVIGHSGAPSIISRFIGLYHMPLFFFISGYFYKEQYSKEPFLFIKKRINNLYLPFIFFGTVFLVLHNLLLKIGIYTTNPLFGGSLRFADRGMVFFTTKPYIFTDFLSGFFSLVTLGGSSELLLGPTWFIISLFLVSLLFVLISHYTFNKYEREYPRAIVVFALFVLGYYLTRKGIILEKSLNTVFVVTGVFYLGHLYKKYEKRIKFNLATAVCSLLILILFVYKKVSLDVSSNSFPTPIIFLIASFAGIYINLFVAKIITIKDSKFIEKIGKNSFNILIFHLLSFKIAHLLQIYYNNYPFGYLAKFPTISHSLKWSIVYTFVGVLIPVGISELFKGLRTRLELTTNLRGVVTESLVGLQAKIMNLFRAETLDN